jgi:hypothetical protein
MGLVGLKGLTVRATLPHAPVLVGLNGLLLRTKSFLLFV